MKSTIGRREAQVFAYAQLRGLRVLNTGSLRVPLGFTADQERKTLSQLSRTQMIARVWRGVYLVPPRLPLGGKWSPGEFLALQTLMETVKATSQICGLNAFNRYSFDEQVPNRLYAYNNRISGIRVVGGVTLSLIKVADARLGDIDTFKTPDGVTVVYSSRPRTLIDAVYDWSRFSGLPRAYGWIKREIAHKRVSESAIVAATLSYGDIGTVRRIGVLVERLGVNSRLL